MKKLAPFVLLLTLAVCVSADESHKLAADSKVKIMEIQLKQERLGNQFAALQVQLQQVQATFQTSQKELQDAIDAAFKEAKLSKDEFNFDAQKYEFTKKEQAKK